VRPPLPRPQPRAGRFFFLREKKRFSYLFCSFLFLSILFFSYLFYMGISSVTSHVTSHRNSTAKAVRFWVLQRIRKSMKSKEEQGLACQKSVGSRLKHSAEKTQRSKAFAGIRGAQIKLFDLSYAVNVGRNEQSRRKSDVYRSFFS